MRPLFDGHVDFRVRALRGAGRTGPPRGSGPEREQGAPTPPVPLLMEVSRGAWSYTPTPSVPLLVEVSPGAWSYTPTPPVPLLVEVSRGVWSHTPTPLLPLLAWSEGPAGGQVECGGDAEGYETRRN